MIDGALLNAVAASVAGSPRRVDERALTHALREQFPGLRVVVCSDDQIPPRLSPVVDNGVCRLYYLDTGEHCVKLTAEASAASGIVVGLIGDDE